MSAFRWTLAVTAVSRLVAPADAALCVKRSGAMVARAACSRRRTCSARTYSPVCEASGAAGARLTRATRAIPQDSQ